MQRSGDWLDRAMAFVAGFLAELRAVRDQARADTERASPRARWILTWTSWRNGTTAASSAAG
jgi:hypothetical protein